MHNSTQQNQDFQNAWDATNAAWHAAVLAEKIEKDNAADPPNNTV